MHVLPTVVHRSCDQSGPTEGHAKDSTVRNYFTVELANALFSSKKIYISRHIESCGVCIEH